MKKTEHSNIFCEKFLNNNFKSCCVTDLFPLGFFLFQSVLIQKNAFLDRTEKFRLILPSWENGNGRADLGECEKHLMNNR